MDEALLEKLQAALTPIAALYQDWRSRGFSEVFLIDHAPKLPPAVWRACAEALAALNAETVGTSPHLPPDVELETTEEERESAKTFIIDHADSNGMVFLVGEGVLRALRDIDLLLAHSRTPSADWSGLKGEINRAWMTLGYLGSEVRSKEAETQSIARLIDRLWCLVRAPSPPVAAAEPLPADDIAREIVRAVAELPDRTSPDTQPEMMFVSSEELHGIVTDVLLRRWPKGEKTSILDGIAEALESRGYAHMTNGDSIGKLIDAQEQEIATAVQAEREAIAQWHDRQAAEWKQSASLAHHHHPADADRCQRVVNEHVLSAAAIRARTASETKGETR